MDVAKKIESLVKKAEQSEKSDDVLKFSQAACNVANALSRVWEVKDRNDKNG